jgi:hypothetical protein
MKTLLLGRTESVGIALGASILRKCFPDMEMQVAHLDELRYPVRWEMYDEICGEWAISKLSQIENSRLKIGQKIQGGIHLISTVSNPHHEIDFDAPPLETYILSLDEIFPRDEDFFTMSRDRQRRIFAQASAEIINYVANKLSLQYAPEIVAFVPCLETDIELALASAEFEANISDGIVIDVDFRATKLEEISKAREIFKYSPRKIDVEKFKKIPAGSIVVPEFEISHPERVMITNDWVKSILEIASARRIFFLTSPRVASGRYLSDSYIICGLASKIKKVGV